MIGKSVSNVPSSFPRQIRLHAKHLLDRLACRGEVPMFGRGDPPRSGVLEADAHFVLALQFCELLFYVLKDTFVHFAALHIRHGADAEFARHLGRDDGFRARSGEGAFDAMDAEGRIAPSGHERVFLGLVDARFAAKRLEEIIHRIADAAIDLFFLLRYRRDHLVDAGDADFPVRVNQRPENTDKIRYWLLRCASKNSGMEILARPFDLKAVVVATTQSVRQAWFLRAEPVVVGYADRVRFLKESTLLAFLLYKVLESFAAVFFHALETHEEVDGEVDVSGFVRLQDVQPAQHGTFVVGAASAVHTALVVDGEGERIGVPAVFLQSGLDVVVSVHEDGSTGSVGAMASNDYWREGQMGFPWLGA